MKNQKSQNLESIQCFQELVNYLQTYYSLVDLHPFLILS